MKQPLLTLLLLITCFASYAQNTIQPFSQDTVRLKKPNGAPQNLIVTGDLKIQKAPVAVQDAVRYGDLLQVQDTISNNVRRKLGAVLRAASIQPSFSAQYTAVTPNSSVVWGDGYIQMSGGNGTPNNYVYYNGYYNNSMNWKDVWQIIPTVKGEGCGIGLFGANGTHIGKFITNGVDDGKLVITTGTNLRTTSTNALAYNLGDVLEISFEERITNYALTVKNLTQPGKAVSLQWVNDKIYGTAFSNIRAARMAIFNYGGTTRFLSHTLYVNDIVQCDLLVIGDSISAGSFAGSAAGMWTSIVKTSIVGEVTVIAASSNRTSDYLLLRQQIFSLKPKTIAFALGINDIASGISTQEVKNNIDQFIKDCFANGVDPIVCTVLPVAAGYTANGLTTQQITDGINDVNTYILALPQTIRVINTNAALVGAGSSLMSPAYATPDNIHPNNLGHKAFAGAFLDGTKSIFPMNQTNSSANAPFLYEITNSTQGDAGYTSVRVNAFGTTGMITSYGTGNTQPGRAGKTMLNNATNGTVVAASASGKKIEFVAGGGDFVANKVGEIGADSSAYSVPVYYSKSINNIFYNTIYNPNAGSAAGAQWRFNALGSALHVGTYGTGVSQGKSGVSMVYQLYGNGLVLGATTGGVDFVTGNSQDFVTSLKTRMTFGGRWLFNTSVDDGLHLLQVNGKMRLDALDHKLTPAGSYMVTANVGGGSVQYRTPGEVLTDIGAAAASSVPGFYHLTGSGNGTSTTISIPHGLSGITSSSYLLVTPKSVAAGTGYVYATIDATNVNFFYAAAPASGTSNLQYDVQIK